MNLTSKEEYGLRAVIYLASNQGVEPIQTREIARTEGIPEQFLEQVLNALRRAGITMSVRGAAGGHKLALSPRTITAGDVIRALSGDIMPIQCLNDSDRCGHREGCVVLDLWKKVQASVSEVLDGTTIQDMVEERIRRRQGYLMMNI